MDWIHCNKCVKTLMTHKDLRLYITTCGCIFCEKCLGDFKDKPFKCCLCDKMAQATKLGSTMPPEIADFFKESVEVFSATINAALHKQGKISEFQKKHRMRLAKAHSGQMEKMRSFVDEYRKLQQEIAELRKEKEILQRKCEAYENQLRNYQNGGCAIFRQPASSPSPMAGPIPQHKFEFLSSQASQQDPGHEVLTPRITMPRFSGGKIQVTPTNLNQQVLSTPATGSTITSLMLRVHNNLSVGSGGSTPNRAPGSAEPSPQTGRPGGSSLSAFLKGLGGRT